ncbi:MAG: proline--tRNA ligase, partial [Verrucomicrobiae bacterium]|nr:proline--tRNA ligase [Verrucomicrobiae bacterium]
DRAIRAGEKFGDADLLGMPIRLTMSKRTVEAGNVEFKLRTEPKPDLLPVEDAIARIKTICGV